MMDGPASSQERCLLYYHEGDRIVDLHYAYLQHISLSSRAVTLRMRLPSG